MAYRNINEYLESGEVSQIMVENNIQLQAANVPEAEGMSVVIGDSGWLKLHKIPATDSVWKGAESSADTVLAKNVTSADIVSVTPNQDVLTTDGSFFSSYQIQNDENKDSNVTTEVYVNGAMRNSSVVTLKKNDTKIITYSTGLQADINSGDVVSFRVSCSKNATIQSTLYASTIELTKSVVA